MVMESYLFAIFFFYIIEEILCGEQCKRFSDLDTEPDTFHCDWGCCGTKTDRHCCTYPDVIWIVVGSCLGLFSIVIAILICKRCCKIKNTTTQTMVVDGDNMRMLTSVSGMTSSPSQSINMTVFSCDVHGRPMKPPTYSGAPPPYRYWEFEKPPPYSESKPT